MKKILISILIVLLGILAYFTIFKGLSIGNLNILSIQQIEEANKDLTSKIEDTNLLLKKNYPTKQEELSTSVETLLEKKEEYFSIAKVSTTGEISKANTEETYLIEYLWVRVGGHARAKGVNLKFDINSSDTVGENLKNLSFTVEGKYIGIIQFISALEDDDKLNFKIENFKMVKNETNLTATFNVRNIRIKSETTAQSNNNSETTPEANDNSNLDNNSNS